MVAERPRGRGRTVDWASMHQKANALPQTREELLALHRETRAKRNAAEHGSEAHVEAIDLIGRIEIEIARIEREMDPPLV